MPYRGGSGVGEWQIHVQPPRLTTPKNSKTLLAAARHSLERLTGRILDATFKLMVAYVDIPCDQTTSNSCVYHSDSTWSVTCASNDVLWSDYADVPEDEELPPQFDIGLACWPDVPQPRLPDIPVHNKPWVVPWPWVLEPP